MCKDSTFGWVEDTEAWTQCTSNRAHARNTVGSRTPRTVRIPSKQQRVDQTTTSFEKSQGTSLCWPDSKKNQKRLLGISLHPQYLGLNRFNPHDQGNLRWEIRVKATRNKRGKKHSKRDPRSAKASQASPRLTVVQPAFIISSQLELTKESNTAEQKMAQAAWLGPRGLKHKRYKSKAFRK